MRKDAFDAYKYGCDGLMGIHWRTINVVPMASALSKATWEIGDWNKGPGGLRIAKRNTESINTAYALIQDLEYYLTVQLSENEILSFPVTAPEVTRTIVIKPEK